MPAPRPARRSRPDKVSITLSVIVHVLFLAAVLFFAARQGLLGRQLKTLAVAIVPRETPPEPEPEPPPPPPVAEAATPEPEALAEALPPPVAPPPPVAAAPPPVAAPPVAAPPPAIGAAFTFTDGARPVLSTADPVTLYQRSLEATLRARWHRPEGVSDASFVAEVEVGVDAGGRLTPGAWTRRSGHRAWDASVADALGRTPTLGRPPPPGFPATVRVRFDVTPETGLATLN